MLQVPANKFASSMRKIEKYVISYYSDCLKVVREYYIIALLNKRLQLNCFIRFGRVTSWFAKKKFDDICMYSTCTFYR
jgi:hypothetical protein